MVNMDKLEVTLEVTNLDEALEKTNQLVELLEKAQTLINWFSQGTEETPT